ncbi:MAG TPA: hypothetical protein VK453_17370 [Micromonosporaceae bacterium]|nr:hypothetical protein [Micromonosporaceae bacterium]
MRERLLRRSRRSTLLLGLVFVTTLLVYLAVRPLPASIAHPDPPTAPSATKRTPKEQPSRSRPTPQASPAAPTADVSGAPATAGVAPAPSDPAASATAPAPRPTSSAPTAAPTRPSQPPVGQVPPG